MRLLFKTSIKAFVVSALATIMYVVRRLRELYRQSKLYCKTRGDFILSDLWKTLSIISVIYLAITMVISPLILWGKLPVEVLLYMNIIWGSLLIVVYGFLFLALIVCSLSSKGRKWFDKRIGYKENDLRGKLEAIDHKLDGVISDQKTVKTRLGNIESRVEKIEDWIYTQQRKGD